MAGYATGWQHQPAMPRLCPTAREQALVFAEALETGVADADEVIVWADGVIMETPRPDLALCEASLMRRKPRAELASTLRLVEGDEPRAEVVRGLLIERLLSTHAAGRLSAEGLARWVFQDAISDETGWGDFWNEAVRYDDALAPIVANVRAYLLPEEVEAARTAIESLSDALQGEETAIDTMRAALAPPVVAVPIVAAFEAEHRAFTEEQVRLLASVAESARAPLELGPEASGTRYAFPDRTFSAVFDLQPNAMQQLSGGSQGQITSKTLGIKDAVGFTRNITCMSSAATPEATAEDTATKILKGMGAKTTKRVRVSLYDAWEAALVRSSCDPLACA